MTNYSNTSGEGEEEVDSEDVSTVEIDLVVVEGEVDC